MKILHRRESAVISRPSMSSRVMIMRYLVSCRGEPMSLVPFPFHWEIQVLRTLSAGFPCAEPQTKTLVMSSKDAMLAGAHWVWKGSESPWNRHWDRVSINHAILEQSSVASMSPFSWVALLGIEVYHYVYR
jgi:hypothetical protein